MTDEYQIETPESSMKLHYQSDKKTHKKIFQHDDKVPEETSVKSGKIFLRLKI